MQLPASSWGTLPSINISIQPSIYFLNRLFSSGFATGPGASPRMACVSLCVHHKQVASTTQREPRAKGYDCNQVVCTTWSQNSKCAYSCSKGGLKGHHPSRLVEGRYLLIKQSIL